MSKPRPARSATPARRVLLTVEVCESRRLLATFLVTSAADNGNNSSPTPGSLRAEILLSNANPAPTGQTNLINFDIAGPSTIAPTSALPQTTTPTVIDGLTQPNTPVVLDGINLDDQAPGLSITSLNTTVEGLTIDQFPGAGIAVNGVSVVTGYTNDQILDNQIGTDPTGTTSTNSSNQSLGNGKNGISLVNAGVVLIEGNVISGNVGNGIEMAGAQAYGNRIIGNEIGTNAAGTIALPNIHDLEDLRNFTLTGNGIFLDGAPGNTIGGTVAADANIISGNAADGVLISDSNAIDNVVEGNKIGTDVTGSRPLGNNYGVEATWASANTVGGTAAGAGNIIGYNGENINIFGSYVANSGLSDLIASNTIIGGGEGIEINSVFSISVIVESNFIGTNAQGSAGLGNDNDGIMILTSDDVEILNNVVAATAGPGIVVSGSDLTDIEGNLIGTDATGALNLGNHGDGIDMYNDVNTRIAGCDIVGSEAGYGVYATGTSVGTTSITDGTSPGLVLSEDHIGVNPAGTIAVPNALGGVYVSGNLDSSNKLLIQSDVISGNTLIGLSIVGVSNAVIESSEIGTNAAGTAALPNGRDGVVDSFTEGLKVLSDIISGNASDGLVVDNSTNIVIEGDEIGVGNDPGTSDGAIPLGNYGEGAEVSISTGLIASNTISDNISHGYGTGDGLDLAGDADPNSTDPAAILVVGNKIGTDSAGHLAEGNQGVGIRFGLMRGVTIEDNIISSNLLSGIEGNGVEGAQITGNKIGTGTSGTEALGNDVDGIDLENDSAGVSVTGNVIVDNRMDGIGIHGSGIAQAYNITIKGNNIGTDPGHAATLGNLGNGIAISDSWGIEMIANVIDSNKLAGVATYAAYGIEFSYDFIGTNPSHAANLGNGGNGIQFVYTSGEINNNAIGSNGANGIDLLDSTDTQIYGNFIGTDGDGLATALGNHGDGLMIQGDTSQVSTGDYLSFNSIVNNQGNGVEVRGLAEDLTLAHNLIGGTLTVAGSSRQVVSGNGKDGVIVSAEPPDGLTSPIVLMSSDIVADNVLDGLQLLGGGPVESTDDAFVGNLGGGVAFYAGSTGNILMDDSVLDNLAVGILFDHAPNNTLTGVTIEHNVGQGLKIVDSPGIVVNSGPIGVSGGGNS